MNMERISPQTEECRRKYFAEVAGRMTCLAAMETIGRDESIHNNGTPLDRHMTNLCILVAEEEDQAFLDKIEEARVQTTRTELSSRRTILRQAHLITPGEADASDYRIVTALDLLRGGRAENATAETMRTIVKKYLIPHYTAQILNNTQAALESKNSQDGVGLSISSLLGSVTIQSEFWADHYYDDEN